MFRFVNRETTIGCKRVIFNGFLYAIDILKTAGQAKKNIDSCRIIIKQYEDLILNHENSCIYFRVFHCYIVKSYIVKF